MNVVSNAAKIEVSFILNTHYYNNIWIYFFVSTFVMVLGAELNTKQLLAMPWLSEGAMIIVDQFQITLAKCWALGENVKNEQPNNFKNKQPNNFKDERAAK